VKICKFWTEKLMEVSFPSFRIAYIARMKKIKIKRAKNKNFKPYGAKKSI